MKSSVDDIQMTQSTPVSWSINIVPIIPSISDIQHVERRKERKFLNCRLKIADLGGHPNEVQEG